MRVPSSATRSSRAARTRPPVTARCSSQAANPVSSASSRPDRAQQRVALGQHPGQVGQVLGHAPRALGQDRVQEPSPLRRRPHQQEHLLRTEEHGPDDLGQRGLAARYAVHGEPSPDPGERISPRDDELQVALHRVNAGSPVARSHVQADAGQGRAVGHELDIGRRSMRAAGHRHPDGLQEVRLAGPVGPGDEGQPRIGLELRVRVAPEVIELEADETHIKVRTRYGRA